MKIVHSFFVFCIMLTLIGCIKQKENEQIPLNNTVLPDLAVQQNWINSIISGNDNKSFLPFITIIFDAEDTRGVTDITEFLSEYLKGKSLSRVTAIIFHQDNSSEDKLENLGNLKMFRNLKYLRVSSNLTSVDINGLPESLEVLVLSNNKLTSFNVPALPPNLRILRISKNNLSDFSVTQSSGNLVDLDLSFNELSSINVNFLPQQFQYLNLSCNNISSFDTTALPKNLRYLDLRYNPIEDIFIPGVHVKIYNKRYTLINIPREDFIREVFLWHIDYNLSLGYYSRIDTEELKEELLNQYLEKFMVIIEPGEFLYGSYNTLELLDRIAIYLE